MRVTRRGLFKGIAGLAGLAVLGKGQPGSEPWGVIQAQLPPDTILAYQSGAITPTMTAIQVRVSERVARFITPEIADRIAKDMFE